MPKTFYTERDIEDLARQGVTALELDDDIVLTDLARDRAMRLGVNLVRAHDTPPAAPERPYIAKLASPSAAPPVRRPSVPAPPTAGQSLASPPSGESDLHQRVRAAVIERLGDTVDPKLLDTIINRVLQNIHTG